jgi:class 3 adenylate cyclase
MLGPSLNMASKVQGIAQPNQIVIGNDLYERIHPNTQGKFIDITKDLSGWSFTSKFSKKIYHVFAHKK